MRLVRTLPWVAALLTIALWIPPLARMKVPSFLEVAFIYGALLIPLAGAIVALVAMRTRPRAAPVIALALNSLLVLAHLLLVGAPVS